MEQYRCPRCDELVEEDATHCPSCDLRLRTSSFFRLPRFLRKQAWDWPASEDSPPRRGWPAWVSFLIAALLIAAYRAPLLHLWDRLGGSLGAQRGSVEILPGRAPRSEVSPAIQAETPPADLPPLVPARRILSGTVYDLMTLKPVPRARLAFEEVTRNRSFAASSKRDGRFQIELPEASAGGYYLKVRRRGYIARALIEEEAESDRLRSQSASKRRKLGTDFARTFNRPKMVDPADTGEHVDLFLVPDRIGH